MKGVTIKIGTIELKALLLARAEYHRGRYAEKSAELPKLQEAVKVLNPQVRTVSVKSNYNADQDSFIEGLEKDIRIHDAKVRRFTFIAEHLAMDSDYELSLQDAEALELVPNLY